MKEENGFTIVELIVSFAFISLVVVGMLTIALNYRNDVVLSSSQLEVVQYKDDVTRSIQDDILKIGLDNITTNDGNSITLTFDDSSTKVLTVDPTNKTITYGGRLFELTDRDNRITMKTFANTSQTFDTDNVSYNINIPITHADIDGDFGIHIVAFKDVYRPTLKDPDVSDIFDEPYLGVNCKTYDDGVDTFLVGRCSKNYVWYSGKLWRVVLKNNETGAVKMVTDNAITAIPYNAANNSAFENSYMDQWLNQEFLPTLHDYEDYLVVDSVWDATLDASDTPTRPAGTTTVKRTVGLLNVYEYYTTYTNSDGLATSSTGYLNNEVRWWLITPYSESSARYVNTAVPFYSYDSTSGYGTRPSVNLKSTIQISSGTGTQNDPYILSGDEQETIGGTTLLNTRYSGEYITFNNELYRIVGTENGLTKIIAVDKPSALESNAFHSADIVMSFANVQIKTDLETYYQSLDTTVKSMIEENTTWYLGTVRDGVSYSYSYKASICSTVDATISTSACTRTTTTTTANIALPRAGEMFTSHITRGTKARFWTLTPRATNMAYHVLNNGELRGDYPTYGYGARPSMYLKSNVVIASTNTGNGTYEKPYIVELGG